MISSHSISIAAPEWWKTCEKRIDSIKIDNKVSVVKTPCFLIMSYKSGDALIFLWT